MSWTRAVWLEGDREEEEVIPTVWLQGDILRYPSGINVLRALKKQYPPEDNWLSFKLVKIKITDDDYHLCKSYDFTTTEETDIDIVGSEKIKNTKKTQQKPVETNQFSYPSLPGGRLISNNIGSTVEKIKRKRKSQDSNERPKKADDASLPNTSSPLSLPRKQKYLRKQIEKKLHDCSSESEYQVPVSSDSIPENTLRVDKASSSETPNGKTFKSKKKKKTKSLLTNSSPVGFLCSEKDVNSCAETTPQIAKVGASSSKKDTRKSSKMKGNKVVNSSIQNESGTSLGFSEYDCAPEECSTSNVSEKMNIKKKAFPLDNADFQKKNLHLLMQIRDDIKKVLQILKADSTSIQLHQFDNVIDFEKFDTSLNKDKDMEKNVKLRFCNVGGPTCHANITAMLSKVMSNSLMALYSLAGQGGKKSFRNTNLIKIIKDCALESYTERDIEETIGKILIRAPDRKGGGGRSKKVSTDETDKASEVNQNENDLVEEACPSSSGESVTGESSESSSEEDESDDTTIEHSHF